MSRPSIGQHMRQAQRQEMLLLPRMLQSIEILQLPAMELEAFLRDAVESNEALALAEPREEPAEPEPGPRPALPERRASREASDRHDAMLQNQPARAKSVAEQVEEELALADLGSARLDWVRFLAGCLDPNGYLPADDEELLELAREAGLALGHDGGRAELGAAIAALQKLEPRGIGARNAIEALLLQLDPRDPDYARLASLIESFLDEVARNKLPAVARAMGLSIAEIQRLVERVRTLDPRPGRALDDEGAPQVVPDVAVERTEQGFEILITGSGVPGVELDEGVRRLLRDRSLARDVRSYLRNRVDRARWIVEAVEQRRETLSRCAVALFARQRAFLEHGPGHLAPLRMGDLAHELGLHVSTVSRAVAGKYAQTPWGTLPLRHFFQASAGSDEDSARDDVREAVRELFAAEDRAHPLSDDEVVAQLAARGLKLARRTVTKYRKELGIPSSYRRRSY